MRRIETVNKEERYILYIQDPCSMIDKKSKKITNYKII